MPMRVQCEQCASTYTLPDSRLTPGRRVQFQCRHCQHRIVVAVPELAESGAVSTPQPGVRQQDAASERRPAAVPAMWFVVQGDGQQRLASDAVEAAIAAGSIGPDTLLWRKGFGEWKRAEDIPEWTDAVHAARHADTRTATPAYSQPAELAAGAAEVAGVASIFRAHVQPMSSGQNAMALPVIRPDQLEVPAPSQDTPRPVRGLQRHEPGVRHETGLRHDTGARREAGLRHEIRPGQPARSREAVGVNGNSRWSPATDTWTGPKGNVTRRVPEEQRQALLRQVVEEDAELRSRAEAVDSEAQAGNEARSWRLVAAAALAAALVAACVAVFAIVKWRAADAQLEACRHPSPAAAAPH